MGMQRADAADGYLGDWAQHRPNCKCNDCCLERTEKKLADAQERERVLREALEECKQRHIAAYVGPHETCSLCERIDAALAQ